MLTFPNLKEKLGRWCGLAHDHGDGMAFWVLTDDTEELIVRSLVRSALNPKIENKNLPTIETNKVDTKKEKGTTTKFPIIKKEKIEVERLDDQASGEAHGTVKTFFVDPEDLIDKEVHLAGLPKGSVRERVTEDKYRVEFKNGKNQLLDATNDERE